jgi:hypothetical protein
MSDPTELTGDATGIHTSRHKKDTAAKKTFILLAASAAATGLALIQPCFTSFRFKAGKYIERS